MKASGKIAISHNLHHRVAGAAVADAYGELSRLVASLDASDFLRPSRCAGWSVGDVLLHVLLDAQRALVTFATPTTKPATVDHVSYWRNWATNRSDAGAAMHARYVRVAAAAYSDPRMLATHWLETAEAVRHVAGQVSGSDLVATQGHSLTTTDFLGTLAVEATVHHLDMVGDLPGRPGPRPGPIALTVAVLDSLLGDEVPRPPWDDLTWVLKGTGRIPLTAAERTSLGTSASRLPLVG